MGNTKIKILNIANMNTDSGVACFLMNYMRKLDLTLFQMDFICWDKREDNFFAEIKKLGGRVYLITSYKKNVFQYFSSTRAIINKGNYDIIHGHEAIMSIPAFWFAKRRGGNNRIAHSHNTAMKSVVKEMVVRVSRVLFQRYCTEFMACSEMAGEYLFGREVFRAKGSVIHNAVNTESFAFSEEKRNEMRAKLGIDNQLLVGHVGRFNAQKNHDFLIDIFESLNNKRTDVRLVLIGEGETMEAVKDKVKARGLEAKVFFGGIQKNVAEWLQAFDIFVLPSIYEGLGIVLIEAQAAGLSCYCSTEVPPEANCGQLTYISLQSSSDKWAEKIMQFKPAKRDDAYKRVGDAGYDIVCEAKKLQNKYIKMGEKHGSID